MASRVDRLILDDSVPADLAAELADRLVEALADGNSVLLTGPADPYPLFAAATRHSRLLRATAFHVCPPLDLTSMLRQVTGDSGPKDATLEQDFDVLEAPGAGCERVVLFVAEAHLLPPATMHYIEFALRAAPHLTVVLAGRNELLDTLALDGFAGLRDLVPVHLVLPDADPAHTDLLPAASVPGASNLALAYRMTPPRLLAAAAAAAGLAGVGMMSLSPSAPSATAVLAGPGAAPSVAAVAASPEPASARPAPVAIAGSVPPPGTSNGATPHVPDAAPLPSPAAEVEPTPAAEAPAATGTAAVSAPGIPHASVPLSSPKATAAQPGAPRHADAAGAADAPAQPEAAQAGAPDLPPGPTPEAGPEVAEAAAAPEVRPVMSSEPPATKPSQVDAPNPSMVAAPAEEPAAEPDNAASTVATLPPTA